MPEIQDTIGSLIRNLTVYTTSAKRTLEWSKSLKQLHSHDKHVLNRAILKVTSAVNDLYSIIRDSKIEKALQEELVDEKLVNYMALSEQLFGLPDDMLSDITDLIDDYLKKKYDTE